MKRLNELKFTYSKKLTDSILWHACQHFIWSKTISQGRPYPKVHAATCQMWYFIFHSKRRRISYLVRLTLAEYWYWSLAGLDNHALPISYTYISCQVFNNSGNARLHFWNFLGEIAFLLSSGGLRKKVQGYCDTFANCWSRVPFSSHVFDFVLLHAVWFWQCCANYSSIEVWHTSWIIFRTLTELDLLIILGVCALNYCNFCIILKCAGG